VFDSTVRFSAAADRMVVLSIPPKQDGSRLPSWKLQMTISLNGSSSQLHA